MYNFDIMIGDGFVITTVMEFIAENTAPDVDTITPAQIHELLNMNEGRRIVFNLGANGQVSIKRLPCEMLKAIEPRQYFPNGFDSWYETHHHIVAHLESTRHYSGSAANRADSENGLGGVWELAKRLTDRFEGTYKGIEWGGDNKPEYFDTLEDFLRLTDES
jgi:hypothetical protein